MVRPGYSMTLSRSTLPFALHVAAWATLGLGILLVCVLMISQEAMADQTTYLPEGNIPIFGEVYWEGDHVVTGNLTIYEGGWLVIEEGDLFFNTSYPGQYGVTIEKGGCLDLVYGQLEGNHAPRLEVKGQFYGFEAEMEPVMDEGQAHVSEGGLLWWDGGVLNDAILRVSESDLVLANYTQGSGDPSFQLTNSNLTLFDSTIENETLTWSGDSNRFQRGHFLELQFLGVAGSQEPIANASLNLSKDNLSFWNGVTDPWGWVGPVGIITERFDEDQQGWFSILDTFFLNLSRLDKGWILGELSLNTSLIMTLKLNSTANIQDVHVIPPHIGVPIYPGDAINLTVTIQTTGVLNEEIAWKDDSLQIPAEFQGNLYSVAWLHSNLTVSIFGGGLNRLYEDTPQILLPPAKTTVLRFNWTVPRAIEYSFYAHLLYDIHGKGGKSKESNSQIVFTGHSKKDEDPTFLGLGYEYWLVILPLLVFLSLGSFGLYREYSRLGSYRVEEIFLLDDIGRVIAHTASSEGGLDEDLVGSMLTALQDFVAESFQSAAIPGAEESSSAEDPPSEEASPEDPPEQKLKRLEHGELMLLIEHGYHCFIVLVISGQDRSEIRQYMQTSLRDIEARFGPVLANWDGDISHFDGAHQVVEQLSSIRSGVQWKLDPRAFITGWRERHLGKGGSGS